MMRFLFAAAISVGVLAGLLFPKTSEAVTNHFILELAPASGNWGDSPRLNCGYHGNCLNYTNGVGLDWAPVGGNFDVWFRGWGYYNLASNLNNSALKASPRDVVPPSPACRYIDVLILENPGPGTLRAGIHYYHSGLTTPGEFPIITWNGNGWGINNYRLGTMVSDRPTCWTDYHVHEEYASPCGYPVSCSVNTPLYGTWYDCPVVGTTCHPWYNATINNATHALDWWS
jgi:hypothetical protein